MDELDRNVISLLQSNGRASNAQIAREVGVSEGTIRRRLKKMVHDQVIRILAIPDPEKLGLDTEALIAVQVDPDKMDQVSNKLAELRETQWVSVTTGAYDIFVWVGLHSSDELAIFLKSKVGVIPGIRRTETFVNLTVKKRAYGISI